MLKIGLFLQTSNLKIFIGRFVLLYVKYFIVHKSLLIRFLNINFLDMAFEQVTILLFIEI